ncbi:hypothetical protein [Prosthecomicrobium sp. N25]|uniref:hypothetical protein n=1 Tax=Prosthecomicrobium sp. N25 TaxID=3129254 RepID=UPI0030786A7C
MFEIVLTVCLVAAPAKCHQERYGGYQYARFCFDLQVEKAVDYMRRNPHATVTESQCRAVVTV